LTIWEENMNLPLKLFFIEEGIRQIKAARDLGWDPSKLSKIVNGWLDPKPEERRALADYTGKAEGVLFPNNYEEDAGNALS
jgi:hypothetical protein